MIDVSRKPTAAEISERARLLHSFAHTVSLATINMEITSKEDFNTLIDHVMLMDHLTAELDIMAQVHDGFSNYYDFPELIPEGCKKPKSRAQLMDELYDAFKALAEASKRQQQQPKPEPPSADRQKVNAEIIDSLEKLGVIPPESEEPKAGDPQ